MNSTIDRNQTNQMLALIAAGVIALLMRFVLLGNVPLNDGEAVNALQALGTAQNSSHALGGEAGYVLFTSAWFFVFGAGEAAARLFPALAGAALVFTPWLFRKQLGEKAASLLSFGLALDAGWTAISRQANGLSWAGLFLVLALYALVNKKQRLLGVFSALALLGGASIWQGLLGLAIAYAIYQWAFKPLPRDDVESPTNTRGWFEDIQWKSAGVWFLGTLVLSGTLLFLIPNGISAAVNGLVNFFHGWTVEGTITIPRLLLGYVLSQPLGLLFAVVALVRTFRTKNPLDTFLIVWWLTALVLTLLYPGKAMTQVGWSLLPALALAFRQLASLLNSVPRYRSIAFAFTAIVMVLIIFAWLTYVGYFQPARPGVTTTIRIFTTLFPLFILIGAGLVIRWFWNEETAGQGAMWGLIAALGLWGLSAAWGATGLGAHPEGQLWRNGAMIDEIDLLRITVNDLSSWKMRAPGELELLVDGVDSPALRWGLRGYRLVQYVTSTAAASSPAMVITPERPSPNLADTYRGQDFVLEVNPTWKMTLDEWLQWVALKTVPVEKTKIILWARADLFPDNEKFNP